MNATEVMLPVDSKGNPDWNYMRSYIQNIYDQMV